MIPPGDFFTNLAASLAYDLLKAGLSRLQTLVRGSPEEQALKRALLSGQFLHVTGERAVAFGADASDVVVVTGDNDIVQVFKGPDADAIRRIFRQILDEIATDRYAASLQEYFAALRRYCANLPYLTLHDIRPPKNLDEVYVPLLAKRRLPEDRESHEVGRPPSADEPIPIAQVLQKADTPHLLILGESGAGKSTLLRQLAERAWDNPRAIGLERPHLPMLVPLRHLALKGGVLDRRLAAALGDELALVEAPPEGFFRAWSQQMDAPWLLLLDGLDEVPAGARPHLMQWLQGMLPLIGSGRVVITGRLSAYEWREWDEKQFSVYNLLPFTEEQTRMFAEKWFGAEAPDFLRALEKVRAAALSGTPLLLTIAAKIYLHRKEETGVGSLPERRSQLYEEFINIWLKEAELRDLRAELGDDLADVAKPALARLALAMTEDHTLTDEDRLVQVAAEYLGEELRPGRDLAKAKSRRFVQVMGQRSGVFLRRGETYGWLHPTFREYLVASLFANLLDVNQYAHQQVMSTLMLTSEAWHGVIVTLAEMHDRPVTFLRWIISEINLEDEDAATLLYSCWQANPVEDSEIKRALIQSLVTILRGSKQHRHEYAARELRQIDDPCVGELLLRSIETFECAEARYQAVLILATQKDARGEETCIRLLLTDSNPAVRYRAADYLGRIKSVKAVEPLISALKDVTMVSLRYIFRTKIVVAEAAARALGEIGDTRALKPLCELLKTDEQGILMAAAQGLVRLGDPDVAPLLISALRQGNQVIHYGIARALLTSKDLRSMSRILRALRLEDIELCLTIMNVGGRIFYPADAITFIAQALRDEDEDVRWGAVLALGITSCLEEAGMLLCETALNDKSPDVRYTAAVALTMQVRYGSSGKITIWGTTESVHLRSPASILHTACVTEDDAVSVMDLPLAPFLHRTLFLLLARLLFEGDANIQRIVLMAFSALPLEWFINFLQDEDWVVRHYAALVLGRLGDSRAFEPLITALGDKEVEVRQSAAWALNIILEKLTDVGTAMSLLQKIEVDSQLLVGVKEQLSQLDTGQFVKLLKREEIIVRIGALLLLIDNPNADALQDLLNCLQDSRGIVRFGAALALGALGDVRAIESLIKALSDPDPEVRGAVCEALGEIGDPRALPNLERIFQEDQGQTYWGSVADVAQEAIARIRQRMEQNDSGSEV